MPKINGTNYSREDFLRHLGNFSHVAGITPLTFDGGRARGTRLLRVATGSGLEFDLLPDRCLDIFALRYRGITLSQMAKNGPTAPFSGLPAPEFFPGAITGGMPNHLARGFEDREAAVAALKRMVRPGDVLLVKGSRGMRIELILDQFLKDET